MALPVRVRRRTAEAVCRWMYARKGGLFMPRKFKVYEEYAA